MTDTTEPKKEKLTLAPGKLSLTKTVSGGKVQQNFTHGRSKTVAVEVRKTRNFAQSATGGLVEVKQDGGAMDPSMRGLTEEERASRMRVLKAAEEQARIAAEKAAARRAAAAEEEEAEDEPEVTEAPVPAAPDPVLAADPLAAPITGDVIRPLKKTPTAQQDEKKAQSHIITSPKLAKIQEADASREKAEPKGKLKLKRGGEDERRGGKITVTQALSHMAEDQRMRSLASMRRQREKALKKERGGDAEKVIREVVIPESITVQELAQRMAERGVDVIKALMKLGVMATVNQSIDADTAELIVGEFGHKFKRVTEGDVENVLNVDEDAEESLLPRPPVVTVMGHVDHGKTSLLDALRKTDVVAKEAGGITQHIGAYQVTLEGGEKVTFLDTPGHEAFTAMRARGAKITDVVILVVAADDGIMAQTVEAINHAKAAGVPIIVAINKIDKPDADANRVKQELMQHELITEDFGGDIQAIEVSAKQGINLDKLVEAILVQAEILELKANPNRAATGVVIESKLDAGRGVITTVLIQKGTLNQGDIMVAGPASGRVRSLMDDKGQQIKTATPGMPVAVLGLSAAPDAGDVFSVVENEKTARDIAEYRSRRTRDLAVISGARSLESLFGEAAGSGPKELPTIIKADVHGSMEAIVGSLAKFSGDEVAVKVLHAGVGGITESDVVLAKATGAQLIAFNVRATPKAKELAQREKVEIRYYSIIYDVVDDMKALLSGMLSPTQKEKFLGYAEIREVFVITKAGKVAGCMVTEGLIKRGAKVRLLRDNVVIHEGSLKTLKRFKDEVKEVKSGLECGMAFENYEDIRAGDQIEAFEVEEVARTV